MGQQTPNLHLHATTVRAELDILSYVGYLPIQEPIWTAMYYPFVLNFDSWSCMYFAKDFSQIISQISITEDFFDLHSSQ